jgi:hypothetical protein
MEELNKIQSLSTRTAKSANKNRSSRTQGLLLELKSDRRLGYLQSTGNVSTESPEKS